MQQVADITFRGTEFTYVGARSYDEGLQKAKSQKPAVVLADSQMPGKSGYDLCMALKSDAATANVPVVILVGNGAPFDQAKGTACGVDANLPKPWDTQTMLEKVTEVVTKAASGVAKPGTAAAAATPTAATPAAAAAKPNAAAAAAAAAAANQPPRSATIMGMPTIKMPAGVAPTATAQPVTPAAAKTTVMSATTPLRAPATPAATAAPAATASASASASSSNSPGNSPAASAAAPALAMSGTNRAPMISGTPTKRSVLVERTLAKMAAKLAEAAGIEPGSPELLALLKLSTEVVERFVWEVVPELAEQIIRENLQDLTSKRGAS